jgi:hypothetical protein
MVRTRAALISLNAYGTLAKTLVHSSCRGTPYTKRHVIPHDPKTLAQLSARHYMAWLTRAWAAIPAASKATWNAHPGITTLTNYHCFLAYNARRWAEYKGPSQAYPATDAPPHGDYGSISIAPGVRQIAFTFSGTPAAKTWRTVIFRGDATGFARHQNNAILHLTRIAGTQEVYDTAVIAGQAYWYCVSDYSTTGLGWTWSTYYTATPLP